MKKGGQYRLYFRVVAGETKAPTYEPGLAPRSIR